MTLACIAFENMQLGGNDAKLKLIYEHNLCLFLYENELIYIK